MCGVSVGALKEYSEWAPVGRLSECKIIAACAFLTSHPDFRMDACAVLRVIGGRRQLQATPSSILEDISDHPIT
jgi:hypothetical protein